MQIDIGGEKKSGRVGTGAKEEETHGKITALFAVATTASAAAAAMATQHHLRLYDNGALSFIIFNV